MITLSRQSFLCHDSISIQVMLQHCLVLLLSRSRPKKSVVTEFYRHLACFLVAALFLMLRPVLLCWGVFHVATTPFCMKHIFLSRPSFSSRDITFLLQPVFVSWPSLPVMTRLFFVQLTYAVAAQFVMS